MKNAEKRQSERNEDTYKTNATNHRTETQNWQTKDATD